jgi:hypothetical protein
LYSDRTDGQNLSRAALEGLPKPPSLISSAMPSAGTSPLTNFAVD